jgi:integrase/recombinase XerD
VGAKDVGKLQQAIRDYLEWVRSMEYEQTDTRKNYTLVLSDFLGFVKEKKITWRDIFTLQTLKSFRKYTSLPNPSHALRGLSGFLFSNGRIRKALQIPNYQVDLPDLYEHYLDYHEQSRQVPYGQIKQVRRVLASLHDYLQRHHIKLQALRIEHLDALMAEFYEQLAPGTCKTYRSFLRGFLKYLYHERRVLRKDLASLLVGPPQFGQEKPPKFLRPRELQRLFQSLKISSPVDLRTYAMVHLAYSLGLRPKEIRSITLDDISFSRGELTLRKRKNTNPMTLPIPEPSLKAVAAYVLKARPKSPHRHLFLSFHSPYRAMSPGTVIQHIFRAMKAAGLPSSAYWLRHTYAQNLLHTGRSIYEIKEMLGHDNIQSTKRYLHVHVELMRKVLFDETL